MIFFLYGDDSYRSRAKKRELVEGFKSKRDPTGMNVVVLDPAKEKPERILEELLASPFLAEKRMVVIEGSLSLKKAAFQKMFLNFLEEARLPETTILVVWEEGSEFKGDAGKLFEILSKEKYAQEFPIMKGKELERWILQEIQSKSGAIENDALHFISVNTSDSWLIHSLIDQLIAFTEGKTIEIKDVKIFLREAIDDNIFNVVDAIISKNSKQVFSLIEEQYNKGEDSQYIFSMLLRQFKIMIQIQDALTRAPQEREDVLAKKMAIHPFVFKKTLPLLRKYSLGELKSLYESLLEIDIKTKTGQGDQSLMLDFFIGKLCLK